MVKVELTGLNRFAFLDGQVFEKGKTYLVKPDEAQKLLAVAINGNPVFSQVGEETKEKAKRSARQKPDADKSEAVEV
jgi:hypothetical protein